MTKTLFLLGHEFVPFTKRDRTEFPDAPKDACICHPLSDFGHTLLWYPTQSLLTVIDESDESGRMQFWKPVQTDRLQFHRARRDDE